MLCFKLEKITARINFAGGVIIQEYDSSTGNSMSPMRRDRFTEKREMHEWRPTLFLQIVPKVFSVRLPLQCVQTGHKGKNNRINPEQ
jgi:hypothetical protein